jgi:hypothetical protein
VDVARSTAGDRSTRAALSPHPRHRVVHAPSDAGVTIKNALPLRRTQHERSEFLSGLHDYELAQVFAAKLSEMRAEGVRLLDSLRNDDELQLILAEFNRRRVAHLEARSRYARRHLHLA